MAGEERWFPSCIGIGSNLNDPASQVEQAIGHLSSLRDSRLINVSDLYRNPPLGPEGQPDYVNAVALLLTRLEAHSLLKALQDIERLQGRDRDSGVRWGPRCIDLDILTYGQREISEDGLTIPHPGISQRNFVLFPLLDVAPELHVPGMGKVRELVRGVDGSTLSKVRG
ncbi:MAG: 2-amino-4-hydroxy-6-hydroxymethyldihydropteridine diphosphokinase [Gammaproteobacteria bacterium]|nr:2-amino-4-hydroxy-6-hydroxymethyldihydropteridine diphosphokinase [Gammaproteobacteria bacterium]NND37556.1 2-amino-4-hydroxy-6-hydroxymethyldihydropteridine diphosphokinase [Gammaproteobacteria bacterium]